MQPFEVLDYLSDDGKDPYMQWLAELTDRQARARILVRVQRMAAGNFGDCKPDSRRRLGALHRLGAGLPRVLRPSWQAAYSAAGRWRQAQTASGHCSRTCLLERLATPKENI